MQFGVFDIMQVMTQVPSHHAYAEHLADAALADQLGLDFYFAAERHFMPLYRTPSPSLWLAAVATSTKRLRVGALAYVLPLHNPVRLAEEVSMLDHLSGGRLEVGVGLGHRPQELVSLSIDPDERLGLLLEGLVLMLRAWRGEPFDHPGDHFQYRDLYVEAPLQRPHPPLWYAGNDPEAAAWAARNGLSLAVGFQPGARLAAPAQAFRAALPPREPGSTQDTQRLALMRHLYVAESDERALDEMTRDVMAMGEHFAASPREIAAAPPRPLSRPEAEASVEQLRQTEVIIGGSPETCARAIVDAARQLGIDVFLANPYLTGVDAERVRRTLRLYAERVAPLVRELIG